ncbi:MAG: aconitate hydratase AcnA [Desulfatibacillaceae bacterium]
MLDNRDFVRTIEANGTSHDIYDIRKLETDGLADVSRLPYAIRILAENLLRRMDGRVVTEEDLLNVARWRKTYQTPVEIPYHPARVFMQDFTGVPAVVDLAAMRDAVEKAGGDPAMVNPLVPVELVVDHSVQLDYFGTSGSIRGNVAREYERNGERYKLLKWAQKSFDGFTVFPPNSGICHQVNLEYLGRVVMTRDMGGRSVAYPDTLVGTDSHTTMINGVGVMGWGVGGIEAEAVMLDQPYYMVIPEVIGFRMTGSLREGVTATDLVLTVTQILRKRGVTEKFVEFFGEGMSALTVAERATIANMSPEYGATMGFFPVDEKTLEYLRATNRGPAAELVERYTRETGLFHTPDAEPGYTDVVELDLATVEPCLAGPARPQDRIPVADLAHAFRECLSCEAPAEVETESESRFAEESGKQVDSPACAPRQAKLKQIELAGRPALVGDGSVVIAAITSCTNTSNPAVLIGAGLLAKNAVERGLKVPAHVKTSTAPGSKTVEKYMEKAGLMPYLEALGFHVAAHGCTTCIGNSGPLHPAIEKAVDDNDLTVASVLSGNRNFEARIHQKVRANYLASPLLVVAYALAGRVDLDLTRHPVGLDPNGEPVNLKDIWPSEEQIRELVDRFVVPELYATEYEGVLDGDEFWRDLSVAESTTYQWDEQSTYIKHPPYFEGFSPDPEKPGDIENARCLAVLGDSVTTDHISPAGAIPAEYPAGRYLLSQGVKEEDFNSYGSRRGNHEVMMRGSFANIRIKNLLVDGKEGSHTLKMPEREEKYIYDAAMEYQKEGTPLIVLGGREYGTGSSRDWAAKGTLLLGVRIVIANSYERIHRSNLVGMGVLPAVFKEGDSVQSLGLDGTETFHVSGVADMSPRKELSVTAEKEDGGKVEFSVIARLDTEVDVAYFEHGGILPYVLRRMLAGD